MDLEFLERSKSPKFVRTTLYGDQEFTEWELEIVHTPIFQRLYGLKQLGFADKVFPDAVHSRFNHVLGVAEVAARMARNLVSWLRGNGRVEFQFVREDPSKPRDEWPADDITGAALAGHVEQHIPAVRLIGLLHDLTHAAFGHTLEDEVSVFAEKHDDEPRQRRFFDALVGQLVYLWAIELDAEAPEPDVFDKLAHLEVDRAAVKQWTEQIAETLGREKSGELAQRLRELEMALSLLRYIEFLHKTNQDRMESWPSLLVTDVIAALVPGSPALDLVLHRDAFFVDIVGNTICADLMDYARRDPSNAGLRVQFDDRLIRYVSAVSVGKELSPTGRDCIRIAMQFFTHKMRYDVVSEMSGILRARYLITEGVLLHPTKCAAGAMLGTAIQLLGIVKLPDWMQVLGDQEFLRLLVDLSQTLARRLQPGDQAAGGTDRIHEFAQTCLAKITEECPEVSAAQARVKGARILLWRLISRRYPKLVYRIGSGAAHSGGENDATIADTYRNSQRRFALERDVEVVCGLPPGSLVIHCPRRIGSLKVAQALVVGSDLSKVKHLRNVDAVTNPEALRPYHDEILAVENMYKSIWQFHAFLDSSHRHKLHLVEAVLEKKIGFKSDGLLKKKTSPAEGAENPYDLLADRLRDTFAWELLAEIVRSLDNPERQRHGASETSLERTKRIIRDVQSARLGDTGE